MLLAALCWACLHPSAEQHDTYTCPMHPTVISTQPGVCPVCAMALVRKARPGEARALSPAVRTRLQSPARAVVSRIKTTTGTYRSLSASLAVQGIVTYDTRKIQVIAARTAGRLEDVTIQYINQSVRQGERIASLYSPELVAAQQELLYIHQQGDSALQSAARKKLILLGITTKQIDDLLKQGTVQYRLPIYSPAAGYVLPGAAPAPSLSVASVAGSTSGGGGMTGMNENTEPPTSSIAAPATAGALLRLGDYVSAAQSLYTLVSPSALRIELNLPAAEAGHIRAGDRVQWDGGDGHFESTTVDFVQPFFSAGEAFVKVRIYPTSIKNLHIGHLIQAHLSLRETEGLWVPREAVVDLGMRQVVFVKKADTFVPVTVRKGRTAADWIEIMQGISSRDEIAQQASYLVDGESFIQPQP